MNAKLSNENEHKHCLCEALIELQTLQDFLSNSSTKYFGKILAKVAGTDTIPFLLITKDGLLELKGRLINDNNEDESFTTTFFRIEKIDKERCCAILSLLYPFNMEGEKSLGLCDVIKLTKTSILIEIELNAICAIQPLDTELLKRKIIIEPKW